MLSVMHTKTFTHALMTCMSCFCFKHMLWFYYSTCAHAFKAHALSTYFVYYLKKHAEHKVYIIQ